MKRLFTFLLLALAVSLHAATYETYKAANETKLKALTTALGSPAGVKLIAARLLLYSNDIGSYVTQSTSCKDASGKDQTYSDVARTYAALSRLSTGSVSLNSALFSTEDLTNAGLCAKWGLSGSSTATVKGTAKQYGEILELYMTVNGAGTFEALYTVAKSQDDWMELAVDPDDVDSITDLDFTHYYGDAETYAIWAESGFGMGIEISGANPMEGHEFASTYGGTSTHVIAIRQHICENPEAGYRQSTAVGLLQIAAVRWTPVKLKMEFLPDDTGTFNNPTAAIGQDATLNQQGVQIDSNFEDFGYSIHYTTDGSTPTVKSPGVDAAPFDLVFDAYANGKTRVIARAFAHDGTYIANSEIKGNYTFKAATPTYAFGAATSNGLPVQLASETKNATFRYTTDGSTPTATNGKTAANGAFTATTPGTYKIIAMRNNYLNSEVVSFELKQPTAPSITIRVNGKILTDDFYSPDETPRVSLRADPYDGQTPDIRYTTDGSIPDANSPLYTAPFTGTNITARAFLDNCLPSPVITRVLHCADKSLEFYRKGDSAPSTGAIALQEGWNAVPLTLLLTGSARTSLLNRFDFFTSRAAHAAANDLRPGTVLWLFMTPEEFADFNGFSLNDCGVIPDASEILQPSHGWNFMPMPSSTSSVSTPFIWKDGGFVPTAKPASGTPAWFFQE